jgi:hypothetical protein
MVGGFKVRMCEGSGISSMAVAQLARDAGPMPAPMTIPQSAKRMEQNAPQMGFGERIQSCCAWFVKRLANVAVKHHAFSFRWQIANVRDFVWFVFHKL